LTTSSTATRRASRAPTATETERFRAFSYDDLVARDKASLDIVWLRDPDLDHPDHLLPPDVVAREIVEDLEAACRSSPLSAEALSRDKE
jgi:type I restriction enzyme M protein